jgi:hypothetical protein
MDLTEPYRGCRKFIGFISMADRFCKGFAYERGEGMKRIAIVLMVVSLMSCHENARKDQTSAAPEAATSARADSEARAQKASPYITFAAMQEQKNIRIGMIHNRIMGLEGEIPNRPISANTLTAGALQQSLDVRLTQETKIEEGVKLVAIDNARTEYSLEVGRNAISTASHDETVLGFYFSIPFENKPWSHTVNWRLRVYAGKEIVIEKELEIQRKDLITYLKATDNPFDVIDVTLLNKGASYKLYFQNLRTDLLIAYYTNDYALYAPFYVGKVEANAGPLTVPEIAIDARAVGGVYFFTHKPESGISGDDQNLPVFGYKVID